MEHKRTLVFPDKPDVYLNIEYQAVEFWGETGNERLKFALDFEVIEDHFKALPAPEPNDYDGDGDQHNKMLLKAVDENWGAIKEAAAMSERSRDDGVIIIDVGQFKVLR